MYTGFIAVVFSLYTKKKYIFFKKWFYITFFISYKIYSMHT